MSESKNSSTSRKAPANWFLYGENRITCNSVENSVDTFTSKLASKDSRRSSCAKLSRISQRASSGVESKIGQSWTGKDRQVTFLELRVTDSLRRLEMSEMTFLSFFCRGSEIQFPMCLD